MFTDPKEIIDGIKSYFAAIPKDADDVEQMLLKVKRIFAEEAKNTSAMWATYNKMAKGDATVNEINAANKQAQELLVSTRFAFLIAMPGTLLVLPALIKYAEQLGIDLVPASVAAEFN